MKSPLVCAALATLSFTAALAQSDPTAVRKQIEANDAAIAVAFHNRHFDDLKKYWSPNMVVNNPGNIIATREDVFGFIRRGELNYSHLSTVIESFTLHDNVAIVMGHEDFTMAEGPAAGKPLVRRYTNVWQRQGDGSWVQIARQATILHADPADVYGPRR